MIFLFNLLVGEGSSDSHKHRHFFGRAVGFGIYLQDSGQSHLYQKRDGFVVFFSLECNITEIILGQEDFFAVGIFFDVTFKEFFGFGIFIVDQLFLGGVKGEFFYVRGFRDVLYSLSSFFRVGIFFQNYFVYL